MLQRLDGTADMIDPAWVDPAFNVLWKCNYLYAGSGPFYDPDVIAGIAMYNAVLYQDIYQVDQDDELGTSSGLKRIPKRHFTVDGEE